MKSSRKRIHESVALSAVCATAIALHLSWVINFVAQRNTELWDALNFVEDLGPISGLYLVTVVGFFVAWVICALFLKGKDCRHVRGWIQWFWLVSLIIFLVMTIPGVYEYSAIGLSIE